MRNGSKPFVPACENNKAAILEVLERYFGEAGEVLELGSGTGQHAVHMARHLPHLRWQTSDLAHQFAGIRAWIADSGLSNIDQPVKLDVADVDWPIASTAAIFTANTAHIMPWDTVVSMFAGVARTLTSGGLFVVYGPFKYGGAFTSEGNRRLDTYIKMHDPRAGIRDYEAMNAIAASVAMSFVEDCPMPANNHLLIWRKGAA